MIQMKTIARMMVLLLVLFGFLAIPAAATLDASFTSKIYKFRDTDDSVVYKVFFTDTSTGDVVKWEWDFDDWGPYVTEQNPEYIYEKADTYNVLLVVTDSNGDVDAEQVSVWVDDDFALGVLTPTPTPTPEPTATPVPTATPTPVPTPTPTPTPPPTPEILIVGNTPYVSDEVIRIRGIYSDYSVLLKAVLAKAGINL